MIKYLTDANSIDFGEWRSFIRIHPDGNIFQTPEFYKAINETKISKCVGAFALQNDKLKGVLIAVIQRESKGVVGVLSSRAIVMGGPVVENNEKEIAEQLISLISAIAKKKAIYTQFRNLFDTKDYYEKYLSQGYEYQEHLNILINLEKHEDELWQKVHSKRRNEIRRARREGTCFEVIDSADALIPTYTILEAAYKKAGLPLPGIKYFISIHHTLGPDIFRIFIAKHDGKIIGTMYALCFNDSIYDWYAGAHGDYLDKYPNDLIPWEVFLWGKKNGFKRFDFGGAGKPNIPYGVREYKKKFGGELISFGRYEKINKPLFMIVAKIGFYFWKIIK